MNASLVALISFTISAVPAPEPFQLLLDHVARQNGWDLNNKEVAAVFHRCVDSIADNKEKAIVRFVGANDERAYWAGCYLTEPYYLHGRTARPYLALAI